ncbi:major facilitator superfamily domain-containing protein [Dipodascopsis tothii]|uniref:major facilitator superfamily domain-containing protein n=1 Tax=Dipodascopsis tothii TaxID=44089 RepID=UPI0034CFD916
MKVPIDEKVDEVSSVDSRPGAYNEVSEERPEVFKSTTHEIATAVILALSTAMNAMAQGAMQIAVPTLGEYFGINGGDLSWTLSSFSLVAGASILFFAKVADLCGRKRLVFAAYLWYALWALISAFAPTHIFFDVTRGLQGFATAACPAAAVGIMGATYRPGKRKNRVMAIFNAGAPFGQISGLLIGGLSIQYANWQTMFYVQSALYTILAGLVWFVVPGSIIHNSDARQDIDRLVAVSSTRYFINKLDFVGAGLSIVGVILLVFGLTQAGSATRGWATPYVISTLVAAAAVVVVFLLWQRRVQYPLMDLSVWKYPGFAVCMAIMLFSWISFTGILHYYQAFFFENIEGVSPILTTIYFVPQMVASLCSICIISLTLHRIPGRLLMMGAQLLLTLSAVLWAVRPMHITYWAYSFPAIVISVFGADFSYNVAIMFTLSAVPPYAQSSAAGILYTVLYIGAAVGISTASTVVETILTHENYTMNADVGSLYKLMVGYRGAFWFAATCTAISFVLSVFLKAGTHGNRKDNTNEDETSSLLSGFEKNPDPLLEPTISYESI